MGGGRARKKQRLEKCPKTKKKKKKTKNRSKGRLGKYENPPQKTSREKFLLGLGKKKVNRKKVFN